MILVVLFLLSLGYATETEEEQDDVVEIDEEREPIELNDTNFEHLTQAATGATTGDWFVMFYADWWGHWQRMKPIWEQLAKEIGGKINVAKINVDHAPNTAERFKIRGFPTLYLLHRGKAFKFEGDRTLPALTSFAFGDFKTFKSELVPAELTSFDFAVRVISHFFQETIDSFDYYLFGNSDMHQAFKVAVTLWILFSPAIVLSLLILWCESKYVASKQVKPLDVNEIRNLTKDDKKKEDIKDNDTKKVVDPKQPKGKEKYD